jgi:hypothetical protein
VTHSLEQLLRDAMTEQADLLPLPRHGIGQQALRRAGRARRVQVGAAAATTAAAVGVIGVAAGYSSTRHAARLGSPLTPTALVTPAGAPTPSAVASVFSSTSTAGPIPGESLSASGVLLQPIHLTDTEGFPYPMYGYPVNGLAVPVGSGREGRVWRGVAGPESTTSAGSSGSPVTYAGFVVMDGPIPVIGTLVDTVRVQGRTAQIRDDHGAPRLYFQAGPLWVEFYGAPHLVTSAQLLALAEALTGLPD